MTKTCAREGCEIEFVPKTFNQIYHDSECCKIATNEKIMQQYHERRARKSGKKFICVECKITVLSRYNDSKVCAGCSSKLAGTSKIQLFEVLGL